MKNTMKKGFGSLTAKFAALLLAFGCAGGAWGANDPTITVSGTSVTISNESGAEVWDNASLGSASGYQGKFFTIPSGTDLASGTILKISSVSLARSTTRPYMPAKLGLSGSVSAEMTVTSGGFATATADKCTYSFADADCFVKVGTGTPIRFLASAGTDSADEVGFRLGSNAYQFIQSIVWGGKAPIVEIQAEIQTEIVDLRVGVSESNGFETGSGSGKVYVSGYQNWLKTPGVNEKELVLADGTFGYALNINNANSLQNNDTYGNHRTILHKVSGSGTLTRSSHTVELNPVVEIYDSSEFTGAITTGGGNTTKMNVYFGVQGETFEDPRYLYNLFMVNNPASIGVSADRTTANNNVVTIAEGKTWTASKLLNFGETVVNGTFAGDVVNSGILTVNGTVDGAIVLDSADAQLVVANGATAPVPTTTVADSGIHATTSGSSTFYTVRPYVAQIGSTTYISLADAIAAVPTDGTETTITMIADYSFSGNAGVTIAKTKNVVLDLNGHVVSHTADIADTSQCINNEGKLTIKDSSDTNADGTGTGKLTTFAATVSAGYKYANNLILNKGEVTVMSGLLENTSAAGATYVIDLGWPESGRHVKVNIDGGCISAPRATGVRIYAFVVGNNDNDCTFNMTGGKIETYGYGIQMQSSDSGVKVAVNISGGTVISTSYMAIYDYNSKYKEPTAYDNMTYNITGGTFSSASDQPTLWTLGAALNISGGVFENFVRAYTKKVNITGGEFGGRVEFYCYVSGATLDWSVSGGKFGGDLDDYGLHPTGFITGGVFTSTPNDGLIAKGYITVDNTDTETMAAYPYTVKQFFAEYTVIGSLADGTLGTAAVMVSNEWVAAKLNKDVFSKSEVETFLNSTNSVTNMREWEMYVLNQTTAFRVTAVGKADNAVSTTLVDPASSETTGFTVAYSLDETLADGSVKAAGTPQASRGFAVPVASVTTNAFYRVRAHLTSGGTTLVVDSANTIGVLKATASTEQTIVAVPWAAFGGGNVAVADLLRTDDLSVDDELFVYNPSTGSFSAWTLGSGKTWEPMTVISAGDNATPGGDASAATVARGSGVLLKRGSVSAPLCFVGEVASGGTSALGAAQTSGTEGAQSWNLVASPSVEALDIADFPAPSGGGCDRILVLTSGAPINFNYKDGKWGYSKLEVKNGMAVPTRVTEGVSIPAGVGFWYLNSGAAREIEW